MGQNVWVKIFVLILGVVLVFSGCASSKTEPVEARVSPDSDEARQLLAEAQKYYADGVMYNMRGEWSKARDAFDAALNIISQIDLEYNKGVSEDVDALLREIAYDYRFTLSQAETLTVESAPVVLSLALSEKPLSELTQKRLKQLMEKIPSDTTGIKHDFPIVINDRVKEKIIFFQTEAKKPLTRWLARSHRYLPMIKKVFREQGLPTDLAYLPLIESGFNPHAYSWAHAVGIWQFIKSTARLYGLRVNWWVDERRDPEKATLAAAKYLKRLYNIFGDWHLALAAYNCGEGRVLRAMRRQHKDNYWELDLPTQTENYVPLFIAALLIAKEPQKYGFNPPPPEKPLEYDVVYVDEVVDLRLAARCAGTTYDTLRMLNPELIRGCTPPNVKKYPLRVPKGRGEKFLAEYKKIPDSEKVTWVRHRVRKGESLWTIARHYGTSVQAIMDANSIRNPRRLRPNTYIVIPVDYRHAGRYASSRGGSGSRSAGTYVVRKGDTPSGIAHKFGVSLSALLKANGLSKSSRIYPGQRLKIPGRYASAGKKREKITHTVRPGESLWAIARKYGATVTQLKKWNGLRSDRISPGQKLVVYASGTKYAGGSGTSGKKGKTKKVVHVVRSGESLWSIARKYGTTVNDIKRWNKLGSSTLRVGQKLVLYVGGGGTSSTNNKKVVVHTVKRGETLWQIARKYGANPDTILKANNITDPTKLKPGDKLTITLQ